MASQGIDPRGPRFNQGVTGILLLVAFALSTVFDTRAFVPVLGIILAAGALFGPRYNLWGWVFRAAVVPVLGLAPPSKLKDPAPPRFALTVGAIFLAASTLVLYAFYARFGLIGWGLALIVSALALLAAVTDICVGCEIYVLIKRFTAKTPEKA